MRLYAPITALLALALLFPASALLAAPARKARRSSAHRSTQTPTANAKARSSRKVGKTASAHHAKSKATRTERVSTSASRRKHTSRTVASTRRKATSADFMKAAEASPRTAAARRQRISAADERASEESSVVGVTRSQSPRKSEADSIREEAAEPIILPTIYNKHGRLIVPPPLKGSHEILVRQNVVADRDGLDRVQDDNDLVRMREQHLLVALPVSRGLTVDDRLPSNRRYARPWTVQFLTTLARVHYARFHSPIQVNSAVRTMEFQQHLIRVNGNAAPAEGETASPHLTGQAIDIAKHGLSRTEIAWLRGYLLPLIQQGRIDVEEEFQQACFHISVYKKYAPEGRSPRREIAGHRSSGSSALAAAVQ
ncbi:DUF5715 family protein [Edaphobacter sp. 12200R-103]|uniref:DUF5715 family protein n=1 Tax=Edaphobacter sp. 12200R-103 TaxID=2703788 RepID=UPI00138CF047|nr:DUF5715 family protein [Edaphobacter sp. 12200R-103]QHS52349.1 hypothetical protein GWR55_11900 [Edaphobacter sp. 12200R-103]